MIVFVPILNFLITIANIYTFCLTAWVILKLLTNFNIVNYHHKLIRTVLHFLDNLVEPILGRLRRFIPYLGVIDLSPLALYLLIELIKNLFVYGIIYLSS